MAVIKIRDNKSNSSNIKNNVNNNNSSNTTTTTTTNNNNNFQRTCTSLSDRGYLIQLKL